MTWPYPIGKILLMSVGMDPYALVRLESEPVLDPNSYTYRSSVRVVWAPTGNGVDRPMSVNVEFLGSDNPDDWPNHFRDAYWRLQPSANDITDDQHLEIPE